MTRKDLICGSANPVRACLQCPFHHEEDSGCGIASLTERRAVSFGVWGALSNSRVRVSRAAPARNG